jgi:hypothetical protein
MSADVYFAENVARTFHDCYWPLITVDRALLTEVVRIDIERFSDRPVAARSSRADHHTTKISRAPTGGNTQTIKVCLTRWLGS